MRTARAISSAEAPSAPGPLAGRAAVEWTWQPWRDRPGRAALAVVAAFGLCVLVLRLTLAPLTALLLSIVVVSALASSFLPARCRVDAEGVALRGGGGWSSRRWTDIRRARVGRRGLFVSPFSSRRWMDAWRALFLPFPADRADDLIRVVQRYLDDRDLAA